MAACRRDRVGQNSLWTKCPPLNAGQSPADIMLASRSVVRFYLTVGSFCLIWVSSLFILDVFCPEALCLGIFCPFS